MPHYRSPYTVQQLLELEALVGRRQVDVKRNDGNIGRDLGRHTTWAQYTQPWATQHGFQMPTSTSMTRYSESFAAKPFYYADRNWDEVVYPGLPNVGNMPWYPTDKEMAAVAPEWLDQYRLEATRRRG